MSLVSVRQKFIEFSGRYDLVSSTTTWADNGADFFLNAGQNYLDRLELINKSYSRVFKTLAIDDWYITFQRCRAIQEVWASDSDYERWQLERKDFDLLRAAYNELPANLDSGDPLYYAPMSLRKTPETATEMTIDYIYDSETTVAADHYTYNGIIFMPPTDEVLLIEVRGLFYQPELTNDSDTNYWTEVHPHILVMAGCRALELMYRNTQGVKDWETSIKLEITGLGMDEAEQELAEFTEMEG